MWTVMGALVLVLVSDRVKVCAHGPASSVLSKHFGFWITR